MILVFRHNVDAIIKIFPWHPFRLDNNAVPGSNSRRQSNVLRGLDSESISSLQGSLKRVDEYLPESSQRKQMNRTPLYLSGDRSHHTLENPDALMTTSLLKQLNDTAIGSESATIASTSTTTSHHQLQQLDYIQQKKPFAMVRPRRILCTQNNEYRSFLSSLDLNVDVTARLTASKSLDVLPNQLRSRFDPKRALAVVTAAAASRMREPSSCSLDAGVALISRDPMPFIIDSGRTKSRSRLMLCDIQDDAIHAIQQPKTNNKFKLAKALNNNCSNGPAEFGEDAHSPLLYRQNSFPQDEKLQQKRWRSLESVNTRDEVALATATTANVSTATVPKKVNRSSIRSWLTNLFQGNGFSDASLRKVGAVQSRVKGFSNFGELSPAPEHESIV